MPSAVSPTSASRSGIDAGGTPCFAITPASSSTTSFQRSQHTTRVPITHWHMSLSTAAIATCSTRGSRAQLRARRSRSRRRPRTRSSATPRARAPPRRARRARTARRAARVDALAGLVAGEQVVAERLDHVVERDAGVRDRRRARAAWRGCARTLRVAPTSRPSRLRRRRAEPGAEQLVGAVEQMDLHAPERYNAAAMPRMPPRRARSWSRALVARIARRRSTMTPPSSTPPRRSPPTRSPASPIPRCARSSPITGST